MAVDRPWHPVVGDGVGALAEDVLGHQDGLGIADVCQLRRVDDVADRVHTRLARAAVLVDLDESTIADLDAGALEPQPVGERTATDADHDSVDLEILAFAEVNGGARQLPVGVWPSTLTPVRMSMFFFLKLRTTTLATSLSSPGRIFGRNSRIVTCEPRSANVLANSQPMAPPPITATRPGT